MTSSTQSAVGPITFLLVSSFANDICAACTAYEDLMAPVCIDVESTTGAEGFFAWTRIVWIGDGEFARENQMCSKAGM